MMTMPDPVTVTGTLSLTPAVVGGMVTSGLGRPDAAQASSFSNVVHFDGAYHLFSQNAGGGGGTPADGCMLHFTSADGVTWAAGEELLIGAAYSEYVSMPSATARADRMAVCYLAGTAITIDLVVQWCTSAGTWTAVTVAEDVNNGTVAAAYHDGALYVAHKAATAAGPVSVWSVTDAGVVSAASEVASTSADPEFVALASGDHGLVLLACGTRAYEYDEVLLATLDGTWSDLEPLNPETDYENNGAMGPGSVAYSSDGSELMVAWLEWVNDTDSYLGAAIYDGTTWTRERIRYEEPVEYGSHLGSPVVVHDGTAWCVFYRYYPEPSYEEQIRLARRVGGAWGASDEIIVQHTDYDTAWLRGAASTDGSWAMSLAADSGVEGGAIAGTTAYAINIPHADPPFVHHLWVFDPQETLRCLMSNGNPGACPYFADEHVENIDGTESYTFSCPADHADAELVVNEGSIAFPDLDRRMRMYRIKRVDDTAETDGTRTREAYCEPVAMELLDSIVRPTTWTSQTPTAVLTDLLAGTRWSVGSVDYGPIVTLTLSDYPSTWAAIRELCDETGLVPVSHVTIEGNAVTGRYIDLLTEPENVTGKFLDYAKDTATIKRTGSSTTLYTALIGLGKSKSDGTFVTFTDEVWTTTGGDPVDKPAEQDWVGDDDARDLYGLPLAGGANLHRMGVAQFPDETDAGTLLENTYAKLLELNHPQFTYEVDVVALERLRAQKPGANTYDHERIRVGDMVAVRDLTFVPPIVAVEPVIETRRCYTDATRDSITLGTARSSILTDIAELKDFTKRVYSQEGIWSGWTE